MPSLKTRFKRALFNFFKEEIMLSANMELENRKILVTPQTLDIKKLEYSFSIEQPMYEINDRYYYRNEIEEGKNILLI